ncbi:RNA-binding E3 ubiquitin-protein ligase MEX3C-like, partial [Etheostoma spectabile]|uniref:RNA-binding E3 ubiquitin-protein ligase MEX3C-like n=1 Tax=Etheostoma spectabile TaxID=54343 RepID=UPI0013AFAF8B
MRLCFHLGASKLRLLSLALLCLVPRAVTSPPRSPPAPPALLPPGGAAELESALLHLRAALDDPRLYPRAEWLVRHDAGAEWHQDPRRPVLDPRRPVLDPREEERGAEESEEEEDRSWEEGQLRAQRGDLEPPRCRPSPG